MPVMLIYSSHFYGALAQLGERMAGSHEVRGSIPLCSTKLSKADPFGFAFFFSISLDLARPDPFSSSAVYRLVFHPNVKPS